jgi:hypothetical protein
VEFQAVFWSLIMNILILAAILVLFQYVVARWGYDSRDGFNERTPHLVPTGSLSAPTRG